jgi:two-component system chemotaxis sensor kinase CheA
MSSPLLDAFLAEARELLEQIGSLTLALEQQEIDAETINGLFRAVHTLKGGSGLFDILPFTQVVHAAEDVLCQVRDANLHLSADHMDLLLSAMDQVGIWLDDLERDDALGSDAAAISQRLSTALRQILSAQSSTASDQAIDSSSPAMTTTKDEATLEPIPENWLAEMDVDIRAQCKALPTMIAVTYTPDEHCFFQGHDPLLTVRSLPGLIWWRICTREPWPELTEFDPYRCLLQIDALTSADLETTHYHFRYVPDQIHVTHVTSTDQTPSATQAAPTAPKPQCDDLTQQIIIELLTDQHDILTLRVEKKLLPGRILSVATVLQRLFSYLDQPDATEQLNDAVAQAIQNEQPHPVLEFINTALKKLQSAATSSQAEQAPIALSRMPTQEAAPKNEPEPESIAPTHKEEHRQRVLKVDAERIDALMDLVGELIVAKNALPFLARRAAEDFKVRSLAKEIKSHFNVINRIADDLQSAVMQVRMIPVGTAFQRFPRLVRDISRKLGKQVTLELQGEETEADKNVVADLSDPLIHLVRNALDHGIENPEEREEAGKPAMGYIRIKAHQQEDRVLIEINDDGRGMDPEVLKRKAYEKNIISEETLDRLTDHDALQLIFAPGFSTAETISDLSGRGVGMDVVRTAVQRAGGEIGLESRLGLGTTVRLSLPVSMTVTQVMMVRVGNEDFGVIFDTVRETVRLPKNRVQRIKQQETMILRHRLLPLYRLDRLLKFTPNQDHHEQRDELSVIVVSVNHQDLGLIVDDVREGVDVILKPLEGVMAQFPLYAGTALLGDGRVLLVLNLKELLRCL